MKKSVKSKAILLGFRDSIKLEQGHTRFPSGATILTFGGIASFLAFPVFLRAKRMDWYLLASCERNGTIERSSEDERTHHNTRHSTQRTRRSGHAMGGDASGAGNSRTVLALNSAGRRSPSRHAARGRVARRGHPLYRYRHRTEDCQPAWKPARHSDDRLQPERRTQRGG